MTKPETARGLQPRHGDARTGTSASVLQSLFALGVTQRLERRQKVKFDCLPSPQLFLVQQGLLATELEIAGERRSLVDLHFVGDVIVSEHFAGVATSAVSLGPSLIRRLPLAAVESRFPDNEEAARALLRTLERQAQQSRLHCASLTRLTGEERVATFLVRLAFRQGHPLGERIDVPMPVGREDIADYLGLNADTVSRIFTRLRRERVIEFSGRSRLRVVDWAALCLLSPFGAALHEERAPPAVTAG